jgi:hypothetical protein
VSGFDLLYPNISVSNKLFSEIAATVDLQADSSGIGMAFLGFGPLHELDAVNPGRDGGRVVDDASAQFVPLSVTPEIRPKLDQNGQGSRCIGLLHDDGDLVGAEARCHIGTGCACCKSCFDQRVSAKRVTKSGAVLYLRHLREPIFVGILGSHAPILRQSQPVKMGELVIGDRERGNAVRDRISVGVG